MTPNQKFAFLNASMLGTTGRIKKNLLVFYRAIIKEGFWVNTYTFMYLYIGYLPAIGAKLCRKKLQNG